MSGSSDPTTQDRQVIPRWRYYRQALRTGELLHAANARSSNLEIKYDLSDIERRVEDFKNTPNVTTATDIVETAIVADVGDVLSEAAKLLESVKSLPPAIRQIAKRAVSPNEDIIPGSYSDQLASPALDARAIVRELKAAIERFPGVAYLWVDMARAYSALGQSRKASHSLAVALFLAPSDRFVLRSAARHEIHTDNADHAVWLLRKNTDLLRSDPWVAAAEIAASAVAHESQHYLKRSRGFLARSQRSPFEVSELASAIATVELEAGADKAARKLFRESLRSPNDNSLAQAQWGSRRLTGLVIPQSAMEEVPFSYEAMTLSAVERMDWQAALAKCRDWMLDEPYSGVPSSGGSFYAMTALDDPVQAEKFARAGLVSNPGDLVLTNNLVVALASQGHVAEARKYMSMLHPPRDDKPGLAMVTATQGLVEIHDKHFEDGIALYRTALEIAQSERLRRTHCLILLHLADSLKGYDQSAAAEPYVAALPAVKQLNTPAITAMANRLAYLKKAKKTNQPLGDIARESNSE